MNTATIVKEYFEDHEEYKCGTLAHFINGIQPPTPLLKQKGIVFILIKKGFIELISGLQRVQALKNNLIVIQPHKPFSFEEISEDIDGYFLLLNGEGSLGSMGSHSLIFNLEFLETWSTSLFEIKHMPVEYFENLFKRIIWSKDQNHQKLSIINAYVITLLLEINQCYNEVSQNNRSSVEITRKFKTEINKTIHLNINVAQYAQRLSITPNHLNKSIKKVIGITATELLIRFKIVEAKYLLMLLDVNITEIAGKLGYHDSAYFIRFFKKHTSLTPTEYRRKIDLSY